MKCAKALVLVSILEIAAALLSGIGSSAPLASGSPATGPAASKPAASRPAYPLWDGKESVADYAKRAGIKDVQIELALDGNVTMKLKLIPAGKFLMGSPEEEQVRFGKDAGLPDAGLFADEGPQHEVTISRPFYMGVTHVTVDQFAAFVKDSNYKTDAEKDGRSEGFEVKGGKLDNKMIKGCSWRKASFDQTGDHPVVQVSWNDANAFCDWLLKKTGKTAFLPTEAQWEHACRAGTKTAYPWGDDPNAGKGWANCSDQCYKMALPNLPAGWRFFDWNDTYVFTSPAGSFKANAFGLYDMIGNAWEWCADHETDYKEGAATDPAGAAAGSFRMLRGGSWENDPCLSRSASRLRYDPRLRHSYFGFRVAVDLK